MAKKKQTVTVVQETKIECLSCFSVHTGKCIYMDFDFMEDGERSHFTCPHCERSLFLHTLRKEV